MINRLVIVVALVFLGSCATRQDAPVDVASQAAELSGEKGDSFAETEIVTPEKFIWGPVTFYGTT